MISRGAIAAFLFTLGVLGGACGRATGAQPLPGPHAAANVQARKADEARVCSTTSAQVAALRGSAGPVHSKPKRAHAVRHTEAEAEDVLSAAVIDDKQLANERGGTETNANNVTGMVSGNAASQLTTGSNTIGQGSFSSSSGIPIVIQNTGNNVLIQNSTILNLQLTNPQ